MKKRIILMVISTILLFTIMSSVKASTNIIYNTTYNAVDGTTLWGYDGFDCTIHRAESTITNGNATIYLLNSGGYGDNCQRNITKTNLSNPGDYINFTTKFTSYSGFTNLRYILCGDATTWCGNSAGGVPAYDGYTIYQQGTNIYLLKSINSIGLQDKVLTSESHTIPNGAEVTLFINNTGTNNTIYFIENGVIRLSAQDNYFKGFSTFGYGPEGSPSYHTLDWTTVSNNTNGGTPAIPTAPTCAIASPTTGYNTNINLTINATSTPASNMTLYFGNASIGLSPVTTGTMLQNLTWLTNMSKDGTYTYYAYCCNSTACSNSSNYTLILDSVAPWMNLFADNMYNTNNLTYYNNLSTNWSMHKQFTDNRDLYFYETNVSRVIDNWVAFYLNGSLSGISYNLSWNVSPFGVYPNFNLIAGYWYNDDTWLSDSHTGESITNYQVNPSKSMIIFKTQTKNNIKIETDDASNISAQKLVDRYNFTMDFDDGITKNRTFHVKSDLCPLDYRINSTYKGHFVAYCQGMHDGNWLDFEGMPSGVYSVYKYNDYHYSITIADVPAHITFNSIGGLSISHYQYKFFVPNISVSSVDLSYNPVYPYLMADNPLMFYSYLSTGYPNATWYYTLYGNSTALSSGTAYTTAVNANSSFFNYTTRLSNASIYNICAYPNMTCNSCLGGYVYVSSKCSQSISARDLWINNCSNVPASWLITNITFMHPWAGGGVAGVSHNISVKFNMSLFTNALNQYYWTSNPSNSYEYFCLDPKIANVSYRYDINYTNQYGNRYSTSFNYTSTSTSTSYWYINVTEPVPTSLSLTYVQLSPQVYGVQIVPICNIMSGDGTISISVNGTAAVNNTPITLGAGIWTFNCSMDTDSYCNQEYANVSTSCGGLATGNYSWSGTSADSKWVDGNWNTYSATTDTNDLFYVNYTVPLNTKSVIWQISSGSIGSQTIKNISVPSTCINTSIQFKIMGSDNFPYLVAQCYNQTAWQTILSEPTQMAGNWVFNEESIFWKLPSLSYLSSNNASTFTILQATQKTSLIFDKTSPQNFTNDLTITPTCNGTLTMNGTTITSGVARYLSANDWLFNCTAGSNQNYTSAENSTIFTINKGIPLAQVTFSPTNTVNFGSTPIVDKYTNPTTLDWYFYRDGVIVPAPDIHMFGAGIYQYALNTTGNANWTAFDTKANLTVLQVTGVIQALINGSNSNLTTIAGQTFCINATLTTGDGLVSLYFNNDLWNTGINTTGNCTTFNTGGAFNVSAQYAGNQNYTSDFDELTLTVTAKPSAKTSLVINNTSPITYKQALNVQCTTTDTGTPILTVNGTSILSGSITLGAGDWIFNCSLAEDTNHLAAQNTSLFTINKGQPFATILYSPSNNVNYGTQTSITLLVGKGSELTWNIFRNNVSITTPDTNIFGVGTYTYQINTSGNANWSASPDFVNSLTVNQIVPSLSLTINATSPQNYTSIIVPTCNQTGSIYSPYLQINGTNITNATGQLLGIGSYFIECILPGDINYSSAEKNTTFVINQATPKATLDISPTNTIQYGINATVSILNTQGLAWSLYRDGVNVSYPDINSFPIGKYNYTANVSLDGNWTPKNLSGQLTVTIATGRVITYLNGDTENLSVYANTNVCINSTLYKGLGNITMTVNGTLWNNGTSPLYNCSIFTNPGTYPIVTEYLGNGNYTAAIDTMTVTVSEQQNSVGYTSGMISGPPKILYAIVNTTGNDTAATSEPIIAKLSSNLLPDQSNLLWLGIVSIILAAVIFFTVFAITATKKR